VFQLIQVMDAGFHSTRYGAESRQRLDLATLNFFGNFRKVYVGEQAMHSSPRCTCSSASAWVCTTT
jgi:exportin-7